MPHQSKIIIKESKGKKKQWYVVVQAANGKVLMTSELLSSKRRARENIAATRRAFAKLIIVNQNP